MRTTPALLATIAVLALSACSADEPAPKAEPSSLASEAAPVEEPASPETDPGEMTDEEYLASLPHYGEPFTTPNGLVITVEEPAPEDISDYDDLGVNTVGVRLDITLENPTDAPVRLSGEMSYDVFAGTTSGEYLMCDSNTLPPDTLHPGRTAEWPECFAVETTEQALFTVYLPPELSESVVYGLDDIPQE